MKFSEGSMTAMKVERREDRTMNRNMRGQLIDDNRRVQIEHKHRGKAIKTKVG